MRVLKFRAWRPGSSHDMVYSEGNKVEITDIGISFYTLHDDHYDPLIGNATHVLQYTGLKDKNGKEIYEGDIVKFHAHTSQPIGQIIWNNGYCMQGYEHLDLVAQSFVVELIGNVYEHSELLKRED